MSKVIAQTIGMRKSAVARLRVTSGKGEIVINRRSIENYFPRVAHRNLVHQPIRLVESEGQYDFTVSVNGGGETGQAGAIRLAIARALEKIDEDFRGALKAAGFLTRDAREVERKKYGQPGARKRYQFSKR